MLSAVGFLTIKEHMFAVFCGIAGISISENFFRKCEVGEIIIFEGRI